MRTRKYIFKASGIIKDPKQAADIMKNNLNKGSESIIQHLCPKGIIRHDEDTVDEINFIIDGEKLFAIEVDTYDWLLKDRKNEIKECFQMAADKANRETQSQIKIDGNMKYVTTNENLPEHFYHLTEKKNLDTIMKDGLIPKRGHNDWKSKKKCTYLTEAQYIVPWLGILKNMDDPVILEVDTAKIPSVEQGRIWKDRNYVPGYIYSEHRTIEIIPPEALRVMSSEEVNNLDVNKRAINQLMFVAGQKPDTWNITTRERIRSCEKEVKLCMTRLKEMGVMDEKAYTEAIEVYDEKIASIDFADFTEQVSSIKEIEIGLLGDK